MNKFCNPVLTKELKVSARKIRYFVFVVLYNVIICFTGMIMLYQTQRGYNLSGAFNPRATIGIFFITGCIQFVLILCMIPFLCANAIAGEKQNHTLSMLLTTTMSEGRIIRGKMGSIVSKAMVFSISGLPIQTVAFVYGGMKWYHLFVSQFFIFLIVVCYSSFGLFCSVIVRHVGIGTIVIVIYELLTTVGFYFLWLFLRMSKTSDVIYGVAGGIHNGVEVVFMTLNPAMMYYQYLYTVYQGSALQQFYKVGNHFMNAYIGCYYIVITCITLVILSGVWYGLAIKKMKGLSA